MELLSSLYRAYEFYVFNPMMDLMLRKQDRIINARREVLAQLPQPAAAAGTGAGAAGAAGHEQQQQQRILEIGLGTGLNLPHYPAHVTRLASLTLEEALPGVARCRARDKGISLEHHTYISGAEAEARGYVTRAGAEAAEGGAAAGGGRGEARGGLFFPFPSGSVDAIVCTLTLCSVSDAPALLAEARRVLRPGGLYLFIEHVLDEERGPLEQRGVLWQLARAGQRVLACGCDIGKRSVGQIGGVLRLRDVREMPPRSPRATFVIGRFFYGAAVKEE